LPAEEIFAFFANEVVSLREKAPQLAQIDTQSNLWPDLLDNILIRLDLGAYDIISEKRKIKTLVARRNDIAHGKKVFIENFEYYIEYEEAALNLMYALALAVVDRATQFDVADNCGSEV
jgi:hypothetical protein